MNLRHLRYFWSVARFGSMSAAAAKLDLSPQTLSGQIADLQLAMGVELFRQVGRRLELTEAGRLAYSYADEIFGLVDELGAQVRALPSGRARLFRVGMTDAVPRFMAYRLLAPLVETGSVRLVASHERLDVLLADLALHRLELVIADRPVPAGSAVKAFNHLMGESAIGLFAAPALAASLRRQFPRQLHGMPMVLPGRDSVLHEQMRSWLEARKISVRIVGEFDDGGLMKTFGSLGAGAFPAPLAVREEIERLYGVELAGTLDGVRERYYAISTERRATDPQVRSVLALGEGLLADTAQQEPGARAVRRRGRGMG
ncbi:LysR family transcriptional regulator [Pseudoxanthomonas mexicana]|jgi:LysR family transcriptional activator of nhaA|uniref:LysR family transcriptional regulator n=1 Tax=Pseudoxanthomonas mexicana TaxID=128785 RepID=UPI00209DD914|nr:LysR family transcriptional regulator [Pseudoxanthomonas mexicana]MCP1582931.1 LysR family transcriptional activator of nhaA [Pseudoxanthomonas mexicana]